MRTRRLAILLLAGFAAAPLHVTPLQAGVAEAVRPATSWPDGPALQLHTLNRLTFGPTAADEADIARLGTDAWIDRQLHPDRIPMPEGLTRRLDGLETLRMTPADLFQAFRPPSKELQASDPDAAKAARQRAATVLAEASQARLLRAVASPRQLQEVMSAFWFNHFNVFAHKDLDDLWIGAYEEEAIRPHALGRFRDLLEAVVRHPAMLFYLDNWLNVAPGTTGPKAEERGINENFARELMELHTLGVDGGYTQADVIALARILTGWGIADVRRDPKPGVPVPPAFRPRLHDAGEKIFLGQSIAGTGADELERALDILASSPATARHISFQLARHFVADDPPPALVERMATRWRRTDGDIAAVLATLFAAPEFRDPRNAGAKFKTPEQFVLSAVRAAGGELVSARPLLGAMHRLGQPLYGCLTPDGYADTASVWLNPDALVQRAGVAMAVGNGNLTRPAEEDDGGVQPVADTPRPRPVPVDPAAVAQVLDPLLTPETKRKVAEAPPRLRVALMLGGPDFMRR